MAFTRVQHPRLEIIHDLKEMVEDAIDSFGSINKGVPSQILFFRDGVSEGEFDTIGKHEIPAIQGANTALILRPMYLRRRRFTEGIAAVFRKRNVDAPIPKITFIIVGKRSESFECSSFPSYLTFSCHCQSSYHLLPRFWNVRTWGRADILIFTDLYQWRERWTRKLSCRVRQRPTDLLQPFNQGLLSSESCRYTRQ